MKIRLWTYYFSENYSSFFPLKFWWWAFVIVPYYCDCEPECSLSVKYQSDHIRSDQLPSRVQLFATSWTIARQAPLSLGSPSKNTAVGCHALLQGIFPTQGLNPGLPHCRWILYHLSQQSLCTRVYLSIFTYWRAFQLLLNFNNYE